MISRLLLAMLRGYQRWVSPMLGANCRFTPSCSAYAAEAIAMHGSVYGCWLAVRRVLRCQPFGGSGHDPVPPK
jgi:uncharacterized protein